MPGGNRITRRGNVTRNKNQYEKVQEETREGQPAMNRTQRRAAARRKK